MKKIKVHNDGKEKNFSVDAFIDVSVNTAFGATEEEAINNLKLEVQSVIKELQEIDYTKIQKVDCFGLEIE